MKKILVYGMSNSFGGIQSFFLNLIHYSDKDKVLFDFALSSASPVLYQDQIYDNGGEIHPITPWGANPIDHAKDLKQVLMNNQYDYVWINSTSASNLSVYKIVQKYSKAEIIIHAHGSSFETRNTGIKKKLLKMLHKINVSKLDKYADYKFAVSDEAADWLFNETSKENKNIQIINNGIETKRYNYNSSIKNDVREELDLKEEYVLLQVGRIEKVKNHDFAIDVFNEVVKLRSDSVFLIIGTGSLEAELKDKVSDYGLEDKVRFLGYKTDIERYFNASDCLILPSFSEGLPLTVLEAQASGLKSIVSKEAVPYTADITGLVCYKSLKENSKIWAKEIVDTASEYEREDQFKTIKNSGFDVEDTVKVIEDILNL